MTSSQKQQISVLRDKGESYSKIAAALNISENTIKSYCRRNSGSRKPDGVCRQCGKAIVQLEHKRTKLYCSNSCRAKWWLVNAAEHSKAVRHFTCPTCGNDFTSYGNAHRKYCSRACHGISRRRGDE